MTSMINSHILIVDDDPDAIKASSAILRFNGFNKVETEIDSRKVMDVMSAVPIDAVILDLFMPHLSGIDLLPKLSERYPQVPVIVMTSAHDLNMAVTSMKLGAVDYLLKPVESELLVSALRKALERKVLTEQVSALRDHLINDTLDQPNIAFREIATRNHKMLSIFQYLEIISASSHPILITGESGTGKELVARSIYRLSGCSGELVSVNLAGLDDTMFSDTLFGHKRGAFTGAEQLREGLIVKAENGVLFLDEIGDLVESSQIRLLRLLQEREFYPVGSDIPSKSKTRIVCASNKDIKQLVAAGKFRNDLYYRLNIHHVSLPPLRERKEDIPLLLDHFIGLAAKEMGIKAPRYPNELLDLLDIYNFPGNIRELQGLVFDAVTRSKSGKISLDSFSSFIFASMKNSPPPQIKHNNGLQPLHKILEQRLGHFPSLREAESILINAALSLSKGNQGIAASMLGIKRQTLNARLMNNKKDM